MHDDAAVLRTIHTVVACGNTPSGIVDAHFARHPARTVTLPRDGPDATPVTLGLILTTRENTPVNRHYFNAKI